MITLQAQQLLVAGRLDELIEIRDDKCLWKETDFPRYSIKIRRGINWPTEGLQVCREAERLLTKKESVKYDELLWQLPDKGINEPKTPWADACTWHATYQQRLEALTRIWYPEKWAKE